MEKFPKGCLYVKDSFNFFYTVNAGYYCCKKLCTGIQWNPMTHTLIYLTFITLTVLLFRRAFELRWLNTFCVFPRRISTQLIVFMLELINRQMHCQLLSLCQQRREKFGLVDIRALCLIITYETTFISTRFLFPYYRMLKEQEHF